MTDHELHELLHAHVADVGETGTPDLTRAAWDRAGRIRRRRTTGAVAGAAAAVAVVALGVVGVGGQDGPGPARPPASGSTGPADGTGSPGPSPDDARSLDRLPGAGDTRPDGRVEGRSVYWGPLPSQEAALPQVTSPLPATIDLSAPAPDLAEQPIHAALAAYALVDQHDDARLLVLAPDGSLRSVDTSRVARFEGGSGYDISIANDTMLSPTGEYLGFPQQSSVLVLTLATGEWRTVHTDAPAAVLHWLGDSDLWLPTSTQGGAGPMYSARTGQRSGFANMSAPSDPLGPDSGPVYRWRMGPGGWAQSWIRVAGLPLAEDEVPPSQVLRVSGDGDGRESLLVYGSSPDDRRPDYCCGAAFWLTDDTVVYESRPPSGASGQASSQGQRRLVAWKVGTHALGVVATVTGYDGQREDLVSSYARIWDR